MEVITEVQLAKLLKVSPRTLQQQRQNGKGIPYFKIGKSVRYSIDVIKQYLQKHEYISTSIDKNI